MSSLATRAELDKLGRTLELEPQELDFLADIPAGQLRALRVAIYELLFRQDRVLFRRLAALARRLPVRLTVILAERVFGPVITARVAPEVHFGRAVEIGIRLPASFWAEVVVHLDPRRTRDLIRQLPVELIVEIAQELVERGDFMTMSRFVDFFPDETIQALLGAIEDEGALLQVAFYMGSKNRLDHLFRMLSEERRRRLIVRVEQDSRRLLSPFLSLLIHVSYGLKREFGDLAAAQGEALLTGYVRAAHEQGMWGDVLPVVSAMSEPSRRKAVNLPILREPAVQESILRAADEHELWGIVLQLVELMDDANRTAVAEIAARMGRETLERAAGAALMREHWEQLLDLVGRMPASRQAEFAAIVATFGEVDPGLLGRIARSAEAHGFGERFERVAAAPRHTS